MIYLYLNSNLNTIKVLPYSLIIGQTLTTTTTTYTLYNSRKFSDYNFLVFRLNYNADDTRQSIIIPTSVFTASTNRVINLDVHSNGGQTFSQITVKYVSDTQISALCASGSVVKVLYIEGYKIGFSS